MAEHPAGAARMFLHMMKDNAELFPGKSVLDIGSGSGILGLYAATLGARTLVATDVDPAAVEATRRNAAVLGFADVTDVRLVPASDMSAYSIIQPDERFDVILSNPPYYLDLDADGPTNSIDTGDLGLSMVRGLENHLAPNGIAIVRYSSTFYFSVIVKFARYLGYEVRSHHPIGVSTQEAEIIFNYYTARLLEREGIEPNAIRFDLREDVGLAGRFLRNVDVNELDHEPLLPGSGRTAYNGFIVIERADAGG